MSPKNFARVRARISLKHPHWQNPGIAPEYGISIHDCIRDVYVIYHTNNAHFQAQNAACSIVCINSSCGITIATVLCLSSEVLTMHMTYVLYS